MDKISKFSILRTKANLKVKIKYILSYLLIYPFWRKKKHINEINENLELMDTFRNNLFETIKNRQARVNVFKETHIQELRQNQINLCDVIINEKININNMMWIELEIEGLMNLIYSNGHHSSDLFKDLRYQLSPSELEVSSLFQTYTTFYINIIQKNRRFPWNNIIKSLNLNELELVK